MRSTEIEQFTTSADAVASSERQQRLETRLRLAVGPRQLIILNEEW